MTLASLILNSIDSVALVVIIWLLLWSKKRLTQEVRNGSTNVGTGPDVAGHTNRGVLPDKGSQ